MHALVAESNVVTRVALRRILERLGYEVDELRDELAAACLLHQPGAPGLAFLSLDTLLVDFEQVCQAMREAQPDVYIVALVPENRRIDAPSVLDAGADDFIIKPASIQETEARVRVIRRALEGEAAPTSEDGATEKRAKKPSIDMLLNELTAPSVLSSVFNQMGLEPVEEIDPTEAGGKPVYSTWAPLLILQAGRGKWLNIRIDLDEENAERLYHAVQRHGAFSEDRLLRVLQEITSLAEDVIRDTAEQLGTAQLHLPLEPVARRSSDIPKPRELAGMHADEKLIGLRLRGDLHLVMTLTIEPVRLEEPAINRVKRMDVLARDVQSAEYRIMLLRAGTMLNDDYIRKIQAFIHSQNLSQHVEVYRPPDGTVTFLEDVQNAVSA